ncbi:hypothetical protein UNDKW_0152 [Undibacterium sp. KW1]|nr:hypothetical protein UNDKW_0152 [Undibacterium sp. KW1]
MASAHSTYGTYYSLLLHDVGYGTQTIGYLFSVAVIAEIVVLFFMPKLFNSFTLKQMLVFSFGAAIVRYLLIGYFTSSLFLLGVAQLLHSFTFGMYHASAVIHISTLFPDRASVKGQAIYAIASFGLGGIFGSTVAGTLWKDYGGETVFLALSGFSTLGLLVLVLSFRHSNE